MSYKIYSDGCYLSEFDTAGVGGHILHEGNTVLEFSTNIENKMYKELHERYAIKTALELALEMGINHEKIEFFSDDMGFMKILSYENKKYYLAENNLLKEICELLESFDDISFSYIPREQNSRADKLSRKYIENILFKEKRTIEVGLTHPKLISKNSFRKDDSSEFKLTRQGIKDYLVIHFFWNRDDKVMQLDSYKAWRSLEDKNIEYEKTGINQFKARGWEKECFRVLNEEIKKMSDINKSIGLVLHDEYILLDKLMRGRKEPSKHSKANIDELIETLNEMDKVVVHKEEFVFEKIFGSQKPDLKVKKM